MVYVHYQQYRDGTDAIHKRTLGEEHFVKPVASLRWACFPEWVKEDVFELTKKVGPVQAAFSVARYELYAMTLKTYSVLDDGTTLPLASTPSLYAHDFKPGTFHPPHFLPLPLLPLSQEYSLTQMVAATKALEALMLWRERSQAMLAGRALPVQAEQAHVFLAAEVVLHQRWSMLSPDQRRLLCRNVWNAFARVLAGGTMPSYQVVFDGHVEPPSRGGAHPHPFVETSGAIATQLEGSQKAFFETVQAIQKELYSTFRHHKRNEHAVREWVHDFIGELRAQVRQRDGLPEPGEDMRRLLNELMVFYSRLPSWNKRVASAAQLFECIAVQPTLPCPRPLLLPTTDLVPEIQYPNSSPSPPAHASDNPGHRLSPLPSVSQRTAGRMHLTPEVWAERAMQKHA